jgi:hypothetical protein
MLPFYLFAGHGLPLISAGKKYSQLKLINSTSINLLFCDFCASVATILHQGNKKSPVVTEDFEVKTKHWFYFTFLSSIT